MKNKYIEAFMPFLIIGLTLAFIISLFFIIAHVFIWGLVIAAVLWIATQLKNLYDQKFGSPKAGQKHKGRVIEHDDL